MKIKIEDFCIRCGICVTFYPELYEMDFNDDIVRIKLEDIPEELTEKARQSIKDCAVTAIHMNFPEDESFSYHVIASAR